MMDQEEQLPRKVYVEGHCTMIPEHLGPWHCVHGTTEEQCCCWCGDVLLPDHKDRHEHGDNFHPLTRREVQVIRLVVDGCTNAQIGKKLSISPHTAKYHVKHIMKKVEQRNRVAIAAYAIRRGIVP
jgi:DNA-binding CsgD family transcriptional regulator